MEKKFKKGIILLGVLLLITTLSASMIRHNIYACDITMAEDTAGGSTFNPGVGVHNHPKGISMDFLDTLASGHAFAYREGGVENPNAANTIITIDEDRTVMAQFTPSSDQALLDAFNESLRYDLLYPYYPTAEDTGYGGFVEDRSSTWALEQDSDKFVVTQARYTWTAAEASQFYADNPSLAAICLHSAAVGFAFLQEMWGYDYGEGRTGIALWVDRGGSNGSGGGNYLVYGHAFALYGAAAYYSASGDPDALDFAVDCYNFLDDNLYDNEYGGYYITLDDVDKQKDTNVNVHMLEALIEFYQALPESHGLRSEVASRLSELLACFHDYAMHYEIGTDCFTYPVMSRDWTSSSNTVSFGHDLELAMLMVEAIVALGQDPLTSPYLEKIRDVVDFTFTHEGYRSDGGIYYTGEYNSGTVSVTDSTLEWWPQAEGLGTACLMRMLFPDDSLYSDAIDLTWSYIESEFIDPTNHGWVTEAGEMDWDKANEWHANYHNGRALMNGLTWLSYDLSIVVDPAEGGTTDPGAGVYRKSQGNVVDITATPNVGYVFDHWTGDVADHDSTSTTVTMDGDKTVTAHFADEIDWSIKLCDSILARYTPETFGEWDYNQGLVLEGMWRVYQRTGDTNYYNFIKNWVDRFVTSSGLDSGISLDKLDNMAPGVLLCHLYQATSDSKYETAAQQIRNRLVTYPRTSDGGLWHRTYEPYIGRLQLDGVFMVTIFLINYGEVFGDTEYCNNECTNQLIIYENHLKYPATQLAWHAWDEDGSASWADPVTHLSPEVWCRAVGWYVVACIEVLEKLPTDHPDRQAIIDILVERLEGIKNYQDSTTGLWYQVVDKGDLTDNWVEESSGCMYTYAMSKAIDAGYVSSADYYTTAKRGYEGILSNIELDGTGKTNLYGTCEGTGVGEYAYYAGRAQVINANNGQGAFLLANEQQRTEYTDLRQLCQAENGTLVSAVAETDNRGFTGASYVDPNNEIDSYIQVTVNAASSGMKTLVIRYANGTETNMPMDIYSNDDPISSELSFMPTGAWTAWRSQTISFSLNSGENTIKLKSGTESGGPNVDWIAFDSMSTDPNSFHFTVTADMRGSHTAFGNLLQAINNGPGAGAFHISVGDIDQTIPENRAVIDTRFGDDFLWYPIIGNHEEETIADMDWLRAEYDTGNSLRTPLKYFTNQDGPTGSVETTYSWDYGRAHFVVLNEYWNGETTAGSDVATDGDIVPELYNWLSADLASNSRPLVFIFGHEPAFPQHRHIGDSLDKYVAYRDTFWTLLEDSDVQVYFCGHTHFYSKHQGDKNNIGDVWQFDAGNAGNDTNGDGLTYFDVCVSNNRVTVDVYRDGGTGTFNLYESVDTLTWESYSSQWFQEDSFSGDTNRVYMKGEGIPAGTIKIGYYDGGGVLREIDTYSGFPGGTLDMSECLFTAYTESATEGTWHAVVLRQTDDLPNTYADAIADPDYVCDDDFYVASSAIPEFPTMITVVGVAGLCFGIYYWMRKRYIARVKD
jgi:unsaturated rhamnogalacturonyl hydrolase